jgi:uncharacterized protein YbjT (DUF2867 family)
VSVQRVPVLGATGTIGRATVREADVLDAKALARQAHA